MQQDIISYVDQQLRAGFSPEAVKQALLSSGYSQQNIDAAFSELQKRYASYYTSSREPVSLETQQTTNTYDTTTSSQRNSFSKAFLHNILHPSHTIVFMMLGCLFLLGVFVFFQAMYASEQLTPTVAPSDLIDVSVPNNEVDELPDIFDTSTEHSLNDSSATNATDDITYNNSLENLAEIENKIEDVVLSSTQEKQLTFLEKITLFSNQMHIILEDPLANEQSCAEFSDESFKNECLYRLMEEQDKQIFCTYITSEEKHDRCLLNYAMSFNYYQNCDQYKTHLRLTCEQNI